SNRSAATPSRHSRSVCGFAKVPREDSHTEGRILLVSRRAGAARRRRIGLLDPHGRSSDICPKGAYAKCPNSWRACNEAVELEASWVEHKAAAGAAARRRRDGSLDDLDEGPP